MNTFDKSLVRRSFDHASTRYNRFTALQRTIGDGLLSRFNVSPLQDHRTTLDIGSGTGYLSGQLSQQKDIDTLYALDISADMLQQTKMAMQGLQCTQLVCADAEELPLYHSSVDAVYSNVAYQWCSDLPQAFRESLRVLKNEGVFIFSTFGERTLFELKNAWGTIDDSIHVNDFMPADIIERYLVDAGFKEVSVCYEEIVMYYPSPKDLMLDLKGMGAHNINEHRQKGLTGVGVYKSMLSAYELLRTDKGIPATFQAVYAYAQK